MVKTSHRFYQNGFHEMALKGDQILNSFIDEWVEELPLNPKERQLLRHFLQSNEFLAFFKKGFKFKNCNLTNKKFMGDMTEARVCFLYDNWGKEAVERYVFKHLKQYYEVNKQIFT